MAIFTKRHYVYLTSIARDIHHESGGDHDAAIYILANALEAESPGFDKDLFFKNVFKPVGDLDELLGELSPTTESLKSII